MVRALLGNRYVVVVGLMALLTAGWNLYVARHDDGILEGRVVDADGAPVPGALVILRERTLTTLEPRARVETGADGRFRFVGQRAHHVVLEAGKDGLGASPRRTVRLYFRGQNHRLAEPLRLGPAGKV